PELFFLLSAHLKFAFTAWPSLNESPSLGRVSVAVGLSASTLKAISFVASTFPTLSVAWYWTKWLPVVKPEIGPEYVVEGPPSSEYVMLAIPEPAPSSPVGVSVAVVTGATGSVIWNDCETSGAGL